MPDIYLFILIDIVREIHKKEKIMKNIHNTQYVEKK